MKYLFGMPPGVLTKGNQVDSSKLHANGPELFGTKIKHPSLSESNFFLFQVANQQHIFDKPCSVYCFFWRRPPKNNSVPILSQRSRKNAAKGPLKSLSKWSRPASSIPPERHGEKCWNWGQEANTPTPRLLLVLFLGVLSAGSLQFCLEVHQASSFDVFDSIKPFIIKLKTYTLTLATVVLE